MSGLFVLALLGVILGFVHQSRILVASRAAAQTPIQAPVAASDVAATVMLAAGNTTLEQQVRIHHPLLCGDATAQLPRDGRQRNVHYGPVKERHKGCQDRNPQNASLHGVHFFLEKAVRSESLREYSMDP